MTEREWLESGSPAAMLKCVKSKLSERKARLFAAACCRRLSWVYSKRQVAVEVAERFADGLASQEELLAVFSAAQQEAWESAEAFEQAVESDVEGYDLDEDTVEDLRRFARDGAAADFAAEYVVSLELKPEAVAEECARARPHRGSDHDITGDTWHAFQRRNTEQSAERVVQAKLLRCIVGNPFRPQDNHPGCPEWSRLILARLARAFYEDRDFTHLPALGSLLETIGCTNRAAIAHCCQVGPHAPGCWVLDGLLERK